MKKKTSCVAFLAHNIRWVIIGLLLVIALCVKSKYAQEIFVQLFLWAGLGCSWNLNCGYSKRNSIGHAAFFGIGAYATALLYTRSAISPWIGMLVGALLCGLFAWGMGRLTLKLRGTFFTLTTIAFAEVVRILSVSLKGLTGGSQGIVINFNPSFLNMTWASKRPYIILCFIYMLVMLIACVKLERSRFGYQLIAVGEDTMAAEMLGVNSSSVMTKSFVMSAVTTAMGGAIYTMYYLYIEPDSVFGMNEISLEFVLICLIGGMGLSFGPILGALILIPVSNILRAEFSAISGLHGCLYGLIMLLVVLARPDGLLGLFGSLYQKALVKLGIDSPPEGMAVNTGEEAEETC